MTQPSVTDSLQDFGKLRKSRFFSGCISGCMNLMVCNYIPSKKRRDKDSNTPNGDKGFRFDYTIATYSKIFRKFFLDVPILIGGIETLLRRLTYNN